MSTPPAVAPLTAEAFTFPEGFTLDNDAMGSFLGILNNRELSPTQMGQQLLELQANLTTKSSEAGSQAWRDEQQAWRQQIADDPELGGANLEKTIAGIGSLMNRFGNDEVREAFDKTGAGNNPHIVRFLTTLVSQLKEPAPTPPGAPAGGANLTLEQRLYPNMNQ